MTSKLLRSRWLVTTRPLGAFALFGCLIAASCSTDHGALARRPTAGNGGAGGSSGASGAGTSAGGKANPNGGKGGSDGIGGKIIEPTGRSVLTLTHGIVDAERVAWCFARVRSGQTRLVGQPKPRSGVAYGGSIVIDSLPDTDLDSDDIVPFAITGDLALVRDLDCKDAVALADHEMGVEPPGSGGEGGVSGEGGATATDATGGADARAGASGEGGEGGARATPSAGAAGDEAGGAGGASEPELPPPPKLRVGALPALPAGSLADGYSLLLVGAGCLGGPAFSHTIERQICGSAYGPHSPTLTGELVVLSRRVAASSLAFQALHASVASGELSVFVAPPPAELLPIVGITTGLTEGVLRPREPRLDLAPTAYGAGSSDWTVQVTYAGGVLYEEAWPALLERSGIDELEIGHGYTLVLLGPAGATRKQSWWNASTVTLVDNDPEAP